METCLTEEEYNKKISVIENKLKEYLVSNFDISNSFIALKFKHTFETKKVNDLIIKSLNLSIRDAYISSIIALFHDYGRFSQIKNFNSLNDLTTMDHADASVEALFNNNELDNFVSDLTDKEKEIVKLAIKYHNKYCIEPTFSEEQKLFCNIIRDADKIDIYRVLSEDPKLSGLKKGKLEQEELDNFYSHKLYKRKEEMNFYSHVLLHISFVFDLNFKVSYKILEETSNLKKYVYTVLLFANFKIDKKLLDCFEYIEKFLKENANK